MRVAVYSAYVAGAWCADVHLPLRVDATNRTIHLQRSTKVGMERAVSRVIKALPQRKELVVVQWHELRDVT
jgi:hypothetical protein